MKRIKHIIGIDEVGRGALAGPVTAAAITLPHSRIKPKFNSRIFANKDSRLIREIPLRDSKKLSPKQRETWFGWIKLNQKLHYAAASVSPRVIDKINIAKAANLAATRALQKLLNNLTIVKLLSKRKVRVFLDGGLYLNKIRVNPCLPAGRSVSNRRISASTIIRGDEKIRAIMLASIIAKVSRDRQMVKLHRKYPKYGFAQHKGYGTKKHLKAIKKYGRLPIHRKSFRIK